MSCDELKFSGNDPGASQFGNFINYYSFHSAQERINNLQTTMFPSVSESKPILCLDVGCNSGELTKELYQLLITQVYPEQEVFILAVDIDPLLIKRAVELNNINNISFETLNVMTEEGHLKINNYLNLHKKEQFDVIFCFSVTMWIHLNNGDKGLVDFLKYVRCKSRSVVIEPQPWKCYGNARRRLKKSGKDFPLFDTLMIKGDIDTAIYEIFNYDCKIKVYESPSSSWNRKTYSYHFRK